MDSIAELIQKTRAGNQQAYDELVRRWSARLFTYVRARVRNEHMAEELTQDAFVKAYCMLAKLRDPDKFGPWLFSIAHRLVLDWSQKKERNEINLNEKHSEALSPYEQDQDSHGSLDALRRSLDHLPAPLREAIYTYYFGKMTYQDAADALGVSVGTINARLAKARAMLRKKIALQQGEVH